MKKRLVTTALLGTVLSTSILTGHANAAEQKRPIYVFTEEEFNQNKTGETEGFGGGPGSDVTVVNGNETYQEYLNRVKKGERLSESLAPIEYVYPKDAQNYFQSNNLNNNSATNNQSVESTDNNNYSNNVTNKQSTDSQNIQPSSKVDTQQLPKTGEDSTDSIFITIIASIMLVAGSLLTFNRFSKEK
ncbi:LPXTG cell wall anchor domain-containing protein [Staphylococcus haemolyticus]|uniref:LPXTG cell wall anchor domain-containing protein n=1 Tax=Staphylococcus haemolyticus TaxID=1283 RepID=UPI002DC03DBF|nr:LPXTG cell wall anchor domain-containing protein [Staphylococcus haemolyticus]MEB5760240.1 LPXTG cell wall anchor domain-containing protein [Staphylococcus haemolyticus]